MSKRKKGKAKGAKVKPEPASVTSRAYEGAMSLPERRRVVGAEGSQDNANERASPWLRNWGRYLDENHDLAVGVLDEIVGRAIGTGVVAIPKPLRADGSINEPAGAEIIKRWRRWMRKCDVTDQLHWYAAQRLIGRGQPRDGEYFVQHITGRTRGWPFSPDDVPYRIELLESEMVPESLTQDRWRQGVLLDDWRRPVQYAVFRQHPGDFMTGFGRAHQPTDYKIVPRELMSQFKHTNRWPATRGVSVFAPVIARLYDIKDLEESERLKNRILASWAAAITKSPELIGQDTGKDTDTGRRFLDMFRGTLIDTLAPGESIEGVGPDYPVSDMPAYIADQIKRVAAGTGSRYSSISRNYDGNYAAQRQELVESEVHAQIREDDFVQTIVREVYERWLMAAVLDGQIRMPGVDFAMFSNAEYRGPVIPWIDPLKEVQADALAVEKGFVSIDQIRIKRGAPEEMIGAPAPTPAAARAPAQLSLLPRPDEDDEDAA